MYNGAIFILPTTNILDLSGNYAVTNGDGQTSAEHYDKKYENLPVNIQLVKTFRANQFYISVINVTIYTIEFIFNRDEVTWYFRSTDARQITIDRILNLTAGK